MIATYLEPVSPANPDRLHTVKETCMYLRCSRSIVYRLAREGKLVMRPKGAGCARIPAWSILAVASEGLPSSDNVGTPE